MLVTTAPLARTPVRAQATTEAPKQDLPPAVEIAGDAPIPSDEAPSDKKEVKRQVLQFDQREELTITRTWDKPVLEKTKLGSIPSDYYEHAFGWPTPGYGWYHSSERSYSCFDDSCENGPVSVYRDVPVYDQNQQPRKEAYTQTLTEKTYDQKKTFLTGAGLGLALGAGAAVGALAIFGGASTAAMVAGGVAGAVLGGAAGGAIGFKAVDNDKLEEVWYQDDISHPTMTGYTERITPDVWTEQRCHTETGSDGKSHQVCETWSTLRGYNHDYYPNVSWRDVGDYTYPTIQHSARLSPTMSGVWAGVAGVGVGSLIGIGLHFLPLL